MVNKHLRMLGILLQMGLSLGCQKTDEPTTPKLREGQSMPWTGQAFDILGEDLNGDRLTDVTVIDHGGNHAQIFYQKAPRQFSLGPKFDGVGFHPGNLLRWPGEQARYLLSAEGENAVRVLAADLATGFRVESQLEAMKPRYGNLFRWPGWADSVVLSPFDMDSLFLLKHFDPATGKAEASVHVPLSEQPPSVLWPGPVTVADIDQDGSDDLLYATPVTRQVFVVQAPKQPSPSGKKTSKKKPIAIKPRLLAENPEWGGPTQVMAADLDRDGAVDLLVPDETKPGKINVLLNDGRGVLKPVAPFESPNDRGITKLKTAVDKDGLRYVLAAGFGSLTLHQMPEAWTPGQPVSSRSIGWKSGGHASALAMQDLDGDGWLDLVLGRVTGKDSLWVHYGPLWESFKTLSDQAYDLDD